MDKKEFLKQYPLQYCITTAAAKEFRKVLKTANESYVLICEETLGVKCGNLQYYNFDIHCPTTGFANAYAHFGLLYAQRVLPIWHKTKKTKKTKK